MLTRSPAKVRERPPIVKNPGWGGWARTRGWFHPWIELGALGMMLEGGYLGGLIAHEYVHMSDHHRLRIFVTGLVAAAVAVFSSALVLPTRLGPETSLALLVLVGFAAGLYAALWTLRRCERAADAHAAWRLGRMWHRVLKELIYVSPSPIDLLVHGTREARLARVMAVADRSENHGYGPGGSV